MGRLGFSSSHYRRKEARSSSDIDRHNIRSSTVARTLNHGWPSFRPTTNGTSQFAHLRAASILRCRLDLAIRQWRHQLRRAGVCCRRCRISPPQMRADKEDSPVDAIVFKKPRKLSAGQLYPEPYVMTIHHRWRGPPRLYINYQ